MTRGWAALAAEIAGCAACAELAAGRRRVVVGEPGASGPVARAAGGGPAGRPGGAVTGGGLVLVGEAPGAAEDAAGRPFVGAAGQLLDRTLAEVGLERSTVAVLNVLKCRPVSVVPPRDAVRVDDTVPANRAGPGIRTRNRAPKPGEVDRCRPFLERQLALLAPGLVVALGLTAVTWFLGKGVTLADARGAVHEVEVAGQVLRVLPTYHPSAALRFGSAGAPLAALREDLAYAAKALR
jgi:DNA polymerase